MLKKHKTGVIVCDLSQIKLFLYIDGQDYTKYFSELQAILFSIRSNAFGIAYVLCCQDKH